MEKKQSYQNPYHRQYQMVNRDRKEKPPFPSPQFLLAVFVLAIIGIGFYKFADYMITKSPMFRLRQIRVSNNHYLPEAQILRSSGVAPGTPLFRIPVDSVAMRLLQNPYLEGVSVSRSLPSTLLISVQERVPVAYLIDRRVYMVDHSGKILIKKPAMQLKNLPLITGLSVKELLKNRTPLLDALDLLKKINEVDHTLLTLISEVHIDHNSNPCLFLVRGGARVEFKKNTIYKNIYLLSELFKNAALLNQLEQIKKIDLKFSDRVVISKKS